MILQAKKFKIGDFVSYITKKGKIKKREIFTSKTWHSQDKLNLIKSKTMIQKYLITNPAEILYTGTFNTTKEVVKLQKGDELILSPIGNYYLTKDGQSYEFSTQSMSWFLQGHVGSYEPVGQDEPQDIWQETIPEE